MPDVDDDGRGGDDARHHELHSEDEHQGVPVKVIRNAFNELLHGISFRGKSVGYIGLAGIC